MDKLKHLLLFALLMANHPCTFAQTENIISERKSISTSTGERIFIHANTSTFISGETLYYKIYCLNPISKTASLISKIAYVELLESNKQNVFKHKVYLENGGGQGDFFIPTTLKTGNYKLIAYTNWMLNNSAADFFEMDITIINPFQAYQPGSIVKRDAATEKDMVGQTASDSDKSGRVFSLETDKKSYSHREKVSIKVNALSKEKGNYSVSVRKMDSLPAKKHLSARGFKTSTASTSNKMLILPELRGELISGSISSKNADKELKNKTIALSIPGKSFAFKLVKTNSLGKFTFVLDQNPKHSAMVIQLMEEDRKDYSIQLEEAVRVDLASLKFASGIDLSSVNKKSIEERSVANQIENAYYQKKKDSLAADIKTTSFFHPLEKEYILDDYSRFPTLNETITEVLLEINYKKSKGNYSIFLRDNITNSDIYGPPLVLLDGLLLQDANEIFDYNTNNIYKVSIVNQAYVYGPKTFSGIINFVTKTADYQNKLSGDFIKKIDVKRPLSPKKYFQPDYGVSNTFERIPDYRYQLLWMPELPVENRENSISFYTSDVSGIFEILLEGFTEKGTPVSVKETIEVK